MGIILISNVAIACTYEPSSSEFISLPIICILQLFHSIPAITLYFKATGLISNRWLFRCDNKVLYVPNKGELMERPVSNKVFVIDVVNAKVISTIVVGNKAHGVVVSKDGKPFMLLVV